MWRDQLCDTTRKRDVLRTTGALGVQLPSTGVQRLECRPAEPAPGFDPNLPVIYWRAVCTWFEARGDHAPEGATFEGRHDPAAAWINATNGQ